jgi:hypothetical protein
MRLDACSPPEGRFNIFSSDAKGPQPMSNRLPMIEAQEAFDRRSGFTERELCPHLAASQPA